MKIDDNPKVVFSCPRDGLEEVLVLPLDIRFARTDFVSPIAYRDAHMVESKIQDFASEAYDALHYKYAPSSGNCLEVGLGDPCIPMLY